jgi:hypothetical protein
MSSIAGSKATLVAACLTVAGCAQIQAYDDANRFVAPGGRGDQNIAAASSRQQAEVNRRNQLAAEQAQLDFEMQAVRNETAALSQRQSVIDAQLAQAVAQNRTTRQEAERLKSEMRSYERQTAALQQQVAATRNDVAAAQRTRNEIAALRKKQTQLTETLRGLSAQ